MTAPQLPVGSVKADPPGRFSLDQTDQQRRHAIRTEFGMAQKTLQTRVAGSRLCRADKAFGDPHQIACVDPSKGHHELR
jgi:hypothetical protein